MTHRFFYVIDGIWLGWLMFLGARIPDRALAVPRGGRTKLREAHPDLDHMFKSENEMREQQQAAEQAQRDYERASVASHVAEIFAKRKCRQLEPLRSVSPAAKRCIINGGVRK